MAYPPMATAPKLGMLRMQCARMNFLPYTPCAPLKVKMPEVCVCLTSEYE